MGCLCSCTTNMCQATCRRAAHAGDLSSYVQVRCLARGYWSSDGGRRGIRPPAPSLCASQGDSSLLLCVHMQPCQAGPHCQACNHISRPEHVQGGSRQPQKGVRSRAGREQGRTVGHQLAIGERQAGDAPEGQHQAGQRDVGQHREHDHPRVLVQPLGRHSQQAGAEGDEVAPATGQQASAGPARSIAHSWLRQSRVEPAWPSSLRNPLCVRTTSSDTVTACAVEAPGLVQAGTVGLLGVGVCCSRVCTTWPVTHRSASLDMRLQVHAHKLVQQCCCTRERAAHQT